MPVPLSAADVAALKVRTAHDAEWAGAIHILTSPSFAEKPTVWKHVDADLASIDFPAMLAERWGYVDRLRLQLAASLYGSQSTVDLGRLLGMSSNDGRSVIQGAIAAYMAAQWRPWCGRASLRSPSCV